MRYLVVALLVIIEMLLSLVFTLTGWVDSASGWLMFGWIFGTLVSIAIFYEPKDGR